jgi:hypothetical protein
VQGLYIHSLCTLYTGAYTQCKSSTPACPFCLNAWDFCSPTCKASGLIGCPVPSKSLNFTKGALTPYCEFQNNGAPHPTNCGLVCTRRYSLLIAHYTLYSWPGVHPQQ